MPTQSRGHGTKQSFQPSLLTPPLHTMKTSSAFNPTRRYAWAVVFMLWWISFFNYADRQAIFSVFPLLESEMGLTLRERGYLGTSFAIVYGVSALFAGMVVDRVRRKNAILGGLQVWSLICMTTAVSRNYIQLLLFRAAEGLGETFYYPASTSLLSDYHGPATRSRALGLHQTSVYIGTIAGGFLAGFIALHYGWRGSFVFFGGLGMVLGVILQFTLIEPPRGAAEDGNQLTPKRMPLGETIFIILRTPAVPFFMLAFACSNYAAMVLLAWMPQYLSSKFNLRLDWAGLGATGPPQLASMVGAPLGGWLADSWRSRRSSGRAGASTCCFCLCTFCLPLRTYRISSLVFLFPGQLGIFQRFLRRQHFRCRVRRGPAGGPRNGRRVHEYFWLASRWSSGANGRWLAGRSIWSGSRHWHIGGSLSCCRLPSSCRQPIFDRAKEVTYGCNRISYSHCRYYFHDDLDRLR